GRRALRRSRYGRADGTRSSAPRTGHPSAPPRSGPRSRWRAACAARAPPSRRCASVTPPPVPHAARVPYGAGEGIARQAHERAHLALCDQGPGETQECPGPAAHDAAHRLLALPRHVDAAAAACVLRREAVDVEAEAPLAEAHRVAVLDGGRR